METTNYAPVIIPTLYRAEHFKRCVKSLSRCTGADRTTLIVGLDYPLRDSHRPGYEEICTYLPTISGFKEVIVLKRPSNYGATKNCQSLREYAFNISDRYIFTEDDNEFAPNFLEFVNKGLEEYKDDERVMGICGYRYLFLKETPALKAYPLHGFSAWGYGCWKDKEPLYKKIGREAFLDKILGSWRTSMWLLRKYPKWLNACLRMKLKDLSYGDTLWALECVLHNKVSIFPTVSKVRNWGNDGTGENCHKVQQKFALQPIDEDETFEYDNGTMEQPAINISPYMKVRTHLRLALLLRYVGYRLTGRDILKRLDQ